MLQKEGCFTKRLVKKANDSKRGMEQKSYIQKDGCLKKTDGPNRWIFQKRRILQKDGTDNSKRKKRDDPKRQIIQKDGCFKKTDSPKKVVEKEGCSKKTDAPKQQIAQ